MKIIIHGNRGQNNYSPKRENPYLKRYGAWGIVNDAHSEDHSVDVYLDLGIFLDHVPVSTKEWVKNNDDYTSGMRDLPPVETRVFIMMPSGTLDDCFVLCSGLTPVDKSHRETFMPAGKETERYRVTPGNWKSKYQYEDGSYELVSPDEKTRLKLDYSQDDHTLNLTLFEKIKLVIVSLKSFLFSLFDDELKIFHKQGDQLTIRAFDTDISIKAGEISIAAGGYFRIQGSAVGINGSGPAAARVGDAVEVTIPPGTVMVPNPLGGQTPNPVPVIVPGKIVAGSGTVGIGG
jgi:hypothetical protein